VGVRVGVAVGESSALNDALSVRCSCAFTS
jgi:hypothetical protein